MSGSARRRLRNLLPWIVTAALFAYIFGWATDWVRLRAALDQADAPLFLLYATVDRLAFFAVWTWLQAVALRRFVADVPFRSVFAVRGGSELIRTISAPASDAAFFLGLAQLTRGRLDAVVSAALVPTVIHFFVMLIVMTLALPFVGSFRENQGTWVAAIVMWSLVAASLVAIRLSAIRAIRIRGIQAMRTWLDRFSLRDLRPFFLGFFGLVLFDIVIQGLASRAFGIEIAWLALAARIPVLYIAMTIPTLGNFGTRELAWAGLFAEFGEREHLIAFALGVNSVFLVINLMLGLLFLPQALKLIAAVRAARRENEGATAQADDGPASP